MTLLNRLFLESSRWSLFVITSLVCLMNSVQVRADDRVAEDRFLPTTTANSARNLGWRVDGKTSQRSPAVLDPLSDVPSLLIRGTAQRNNPYRRELAETFAEDELFVGFRFLYEVNENAGPDDPEFFVLWLDRTDGSDHAVHNTEVPNIGIHRADDGPAKGKNVFMVRFGNRKTAWSHHELQPGKVYQLIARISKEMPGVRNGYSRLDLWVDPQPGDQDRPVLTLRRQAGIHQFRWVGFATGEKTEPEDRIRIGDLVLSRSWEDACSFLASDVEIDGNSVAQAMQTKTTRTGRVDFRNEVYPLLKARCFECHAGEFPDSGYRLDVRSEILGHSTGEPLAQPGKSRVSPLIKVLISTSDSERMPPDGKPLSDEEIALVRAWIDQGLDWDDELLPEPRGESSHWAFQVVNRPEVPQFENQELRHPIDAFIERRLHEQGLEPVRQADRRTLIRRLSLDLLALPPSVEEVEEFVNDPSPRAYEDLVEGILSSPHYGERMGRLWLDLARWGESEGHQHDIPRPFAWRYRDYVIHSFNQDKAYHQFLREQLAGDELQPYSDEALIATGFLAAARISGNQLDKTLQRAEVLFDITDNSASALLGLTLECAQCHNHKFEPLSQREYYQFMAFFSRGQLGNLQLQETPQVPASEIRKWFSKGAYDFYLREAKQLKIDPANYPSHTWGFYSPVTGDPKIEYLPVVNRSPLPYSKSFLEQQATQIFVRGDPHNPGLPVEPGWPAVLGTMPSELTPSPRQALADWMGSRENPLVARVWVNRLWQLHFGRGIVSTPSDFGTHGAAPSHPELLDWLASELIQNGWSTRHIHKLIVTSDTYRRSSEFHTSNHEKDPENIFLWRWMPRRLDAEAIRDSLLTVTGELNRSVGGPSISPARDEQERRRTIYLSQRRSELPDVMQMFDAPDAVRSCSRREVSTVALQPLYLLNSPFVIERSRQLAKLAFKEAKGDPAECVQIAFARTLGREPSQQELQLSLDFLSGDGVENVSENLQPHPAFIRFCHSLINLNEFVYLP